MAKIKVAGYNDLLDVPDDKAVELSQKRASGEIMPQDYVEIGDFHGESRQIKAIFVGSGKDAAEKQSEEFRAKQREFFDKRRALLSLDPEDRAKTSAWGHYCLFHWMIYRKKPHESLKPEIQAVAAAFYAQHPEWSKPSLGLWWHYLKLRGDTPVEMNSFRILERVEQRELGDIGPGLNTFELRAPQNPPKVRASGLEPMIETPF